MRIKFWPGRSLLIVAIRKKNSFRVDWQYQELTNDPDFPDWGWAPPGFLERLKGKPIEKQ